MRLLSSSSTALALVLLWTVPAQARPAPLDVRVTAHVLEGVIHSRSKTQDIIDGLGNSSWSGTVSLTEKWSGLKPASPRLRRPATARSPKTFFIPVSYRRTRTGEGILRPLGGDAATPSLTCGPSPGRAKITEAARTTMRMIDEPAKGRVTFTGPAVEFSGPTCAGPGGDPLRTLGTLPADQRDPELPSGFVRTWRTMVPRGDVAAGGVLHFNGGLLTRWMLDDVAPHDVVGFATVTGDFAIDLEIESLRGRRLSVRAGSR